MTTEKNILEEKNNLESLINYQKDSVVSKTIIGKKTGTVTLFAFDKGQSLSEHTAPFDAIVYSVDGEAQITIADKMVEVKKGDMIILPANIPHSLNAVSQYKMLLVMIKS
ncbi:MAG: cupin domain-containing protein [Bacteroidota bacterium]